METGITFFGAVDRKDGRMDGEVMATEPAWALENQVEDLRDQITQQQGRIERGEVPAQELEYARSELRLFKKRYDEIMESRPKITGKNKDDLAAFREDLMGKISDSMPSYDEIQKGHVDPQEDLKRQKQPCIKVNPEMARMFNVETDSRGRVSRDDATRMFKIASRYLGESAYSETLRRDRKG